MRGKFLNFLAKLRESMWLLPTAMATTAVAAALGLAFLQSRVDFPQVVTSYLYSGESSGARAILSEIAGSVIGVTGVVFSVTIVALTLASGQFGPRLLRNFTRDRAVQAVMGTFIATFAFALVALRSITEAGHEAGGYLFVVVGVILGLTSIGVLIFFIHHIVSSIQAETIISNVAQELAARVDDLYPEKAGEPLRSVEEMALPSTFAARAHPVPAPRDGYLQSLNPDDMLQLAKKHDLVISLDRRPGDFVVKGHVVLRVWPPERVDAELKKTLAKAFVIGPRRTAEEDVEFLIGQLVEMAVRALSPGINDPFTAIACIDRLGAVLHDLSERKMPSPWRKDDTGTLRVVADRPTLEGITGRALDPIRQYGSTSAVVSLRLLATLEMLARSNANRPERAALFVAHADRVLRSSRLSDHEADDARAIDAAHARVSTTAGA